MNSNPTLKNAAQIAVATLALLFLGALFFWRERTLFVDDAFIPSLIINDGKLAIQENRYGSFITQLIPLLGSKLHLSLKAILIAYTASFNLLFLLVIALLTFRYKQYTLAILMALYYTIFASDSFYWTNNEVYQGVAWMFLCLGIIFWKNERKVALWQYAATVILFGGLAIFTHPLVGIILLYLISFMALSKRYWPFSKKESVIIGLLFILIFAAKFYISQSSDSYDSGKMNEITHTTLPLVLKTFTGAAADSFFQECKTNYRWIFPIIVLGIAAAVRQRNFLPVIWTVICCLAYFIFICLVYGDRYDFHTRFYMQSEWMGFAVLLSAPFVFYFLPMISGKKAVVLLAMIFATRLVYIGAASKIFTQRLVYINGLLAQMDKNGWTKAIIRKEPKVEDALIMVWGLPVETMMIDKMNGRQPQRTMIVLPDEWINDRYTSLGNIWLSPFRNVAWNTLNPRYFAIDTVQAYHVVSAEQFRKGQDTGYAVPKKP